MVEVGFPTGYERRLPPGALLVLRDRRRRLLAGARGRVLDLGGCEAHVALLTDADVSGMVVLTTPEEGGARLRRRAAESPVPVEVRDQRLEELADTGERCDTGVSVLHLARRDDLEGGFHAVRRLLAPEGVLLFLEPTAE